MQTSTTSKLFQLVSKHGVTFSNAVVMAPMTRSRAIGALPNDLMASYYGLRADGGLLITEGTSPSPDGIGYARTPGIFNEAQVAGWRKVTDAVHGGNGKIFTQLMHVGRVAHAANQQPGASIVAPSAVAAEGDIWTDALGLQPKAAPLMMQADKIRQTIEDFTQAAKHAVAAGFDGVELHGANGYLIEQFLNPHSNRRTDHYGGSVENRARFAIEVTRSVVAAIGKEKVGIRISPYSIFNDMPAYKETFDTYTYLVKELSKLDILYLHLVDYAARSSEEGLALIRSIRADFQNILILNGGYTGARAANALDAGEADMVSFGTAYLANPDLPTRLRLGLPLNMPDVNTFYTPGEKGYLDYPLAAMS